MNHATLSACGSLTAAKDVPFCGCWCGTVTITTRPKDELPSNRGSILNRTEKFISSQNIQTVFGVYADSSSICVGPVPRGSTAVPSFQMTIAIPLPPIYLNDVHSDNYTSRRVC